MNLITHPQRLFSLSRSFIQQRNEKNTDRFEAHRLKIKLQNESNVNILKLCFFYYLHTNSQF